jgi:hypothetical protein
MSDYDRAPLTAWLRHTRKMARHFRRMAHEMVKKEISYEKMRDQFYKDDDKEAIDRAFSQFADARGRICNPPMNGASEFMNAGMAGGARRKNRRRATRRHRRHH